MTTEHALQTEETLFVDTVLGQTIRVTIVDDVGFTSELVYDAVDPEDPIAANLRDYEDQFVRFGVEVLLDRRTRTVTVHARDRQHGFKITNRFRDVTVLVITSIPHDGKTPTSQQIYVHSDRPGEPLS